MTTTYYADFDLATGDNDGTTAANAWQTFADVIAGSNGTAPAASDTVLCKGTDTLSATVNVTGIGGAYNTGYIRFIGVNALWENVGDTTRAVIDANGQNISALTFNNAKYLWFENFEVKGAGSSGTATHGVSCITAGSEYTVWVNCTFHNNYGSGVYANSLLDHARFFMCSFYSNASHGIVAHRYGITAFCRAYSNTAIGFSAAFCLHIGCIAHDNGTYGFSGYSSGCINCVADSNSTSGISYTNPSGIGVAIGCRVTSNGIGVNEEALLRMLLFYCYGDNTTETYGDYDEILHNGAATVTLNGTDTDEGYTDSSANNFDLVSSATYFSTAIAIP